MSNISEICEFLFNIVAKDFSYHNLPAGRRASLIENYGNVHERMFGHCCCVGIERIETERSKERNQIRDFKLLSVF